jgi:1-acyl-sn-glycerol-3-phosphate acyltransferase
MTDHADTVCSDAALAMGEARGLRVALSPYLFRGMLIGMAAAAIVLHRVTGSRALAWRFAKARARTLAWLLGVGVRVTGLERIATGGPFVFTPNHQSHLDILVLLGHLPGETRFAAKHTLWRHRIMAGILDTLGMVPIDREHPERAVDVLNRTAAEHSSLVIFPEGTRSRTGALLPFHKGAFVLAIRTGLPIVPLVCRGTRRLMPRGSRMNVVPGEVEIVVEAPIPTAGLGYDDRDELAARVRAAMERHHTGW